MSAALSERVNALEVELRRLRWSAALAIMAIASVLVVFRTPLITSPTVWTEEVVLLDQRGEVRGRFGVDEQQAHLRIYDEAGRVQILIAATPHGPFLSLSGVDGGVKLASGVAQGGGYVLLYGPEDETPQAAVTASTDGPVVSLYGGDGMEHAALRYKRPDRAEATDAAKSGPSLVLTGDDGKVKFRVP